MESRQSNKFFHRTSRRLIVVKETRQRKSPKKQDDGYQSVLVRLPAELKERAHAAAQRNNVSLNAWMTAAIIVFHARFVGVATRMNDERFIAIIADANYVATKTDITGKTYTDWTRDGLKIKKTLREMQVIGIVDGD